MQQNILLIQGDPAAGAIVRDTINNCCNGIFRVEWVKRCSEGLELLQKPGAEVGGILVDLFLPDSQGIETFDKLFETSPSVPILVLSDPQQVDVAREAVERGAQDYLLKDRATAEALPKALESMLERSATAEVLFEEKERTQAILSSIGDAVIGTDVAGNVNYLNRAAERMTDWSQDEAAHQPLQQVLRIVSCNDREAVLDPTALAIQQNKSVGLTQNCVLLRRDGYESSIEGSASPVHDRTGRISGAVTVFRDVSKAHALSARMSYLAQHDSLTDLPNRLLFNDRLSQAMALARRHQQNLAMLFVDVDRFKYINDSLGHEVGDKLLQSIARRLINCVRSSDTVSRQGGDEFVVLLSEVKQARDAATIADKILTALSMPHSVNEHDLHITASIGIAVYPDDGTDGETLRKNADFAMLHAKDNGRNCYQFFKRDMNLRALERQAVESDLRHALQRGEFSLHYQPKMDLEAKTICGVEALLRWNHPRRGLVPNSQFMSVAEESGLMVHIGRWVLHEACRQAKAWLDAGLQPMTMAINISAVELRAKDFVSNLRNIILEAGIEPKCLELELNEAFLMQDSKAITPVMQSLKDLGVGLALDDFGTGYSSLTYLKRFPIDALKIDHSFVRDVITDEEDAGIVTAVISMANSLHMRVIAEGVETQEQLAFLRAQNCGEAQGYYFSRPLAAEEFTKLLMPHHGTRRAS